MNKQQLVDLSWIGDNLHNFMMRYSQELKDDPEMRVRLEIAHDLILECMDALRPE